MANVLSFEIPKNLTNYREPDSIYELSIDDLFVDMRTTLGFAADLIKSHRFLVLSWLEYQDFLKPKEEWSPLTKDTISAQKSDFNNKLKSLRGNAVTLIGGERVSLRDARFVLRDVNDDRQDLAKLSGIITEVLFLELVVYDAENLRWMSVQDYQVKKIEGAE